MVMTERKPAVGTMGNRLERIKFAHSAFSEIRRDDEPLYNHILSELPAMETEQSAIWHMRTWAFMYRYAKDNNLGEFPINEITDCKAESAFITIYKNEKTREGQQLTSGDFREYLRDRDEKILNQNPKLYDEISRLREFAIAQGATIEAMVAINKAVLDSYRILQMEPR